MRLASCAKRVTIPFAGFYCSEHDGKHYEEKLESQSRSRDFIVLSGAFVAGCSFVGSQSRSRDFIVLRKVKAHLPNMQVQVTIPFAGFYCSETIVWEKEDIMAVTIPFAGFYCSETHFLWHHEVKCCHNPVRGILLF